MEFDQLPGNSQAEPQASMPPHEFGVGLPERLEDERQEVGCDARARVGDGDFDRVIADTTCCGGDAPALSGEFGVAPNPP